MRNATHEIEELNRRLAEAEREGDPAAIERLLADGFRVVGPLGFVLEKEQWLGQFRSAALHIDSIDWSRTDVRDYGDAAVAVSRMDQAGAYGDQPANGRFRVTEVAVRRDGEWRLASLHVGALNDAADAADAAASGARPREVTA